MTDANGSIPAQTSAPQPSMARLVDRLTEELADAQQRNLVSRNIGVVLAVIVVLYVGWVTQNINRMLEPEEVALAAAGLVVDATPSIGNHLRSVVVDGAPDLARLVTTAAIDMVPAYREVAQAELVPMIDEACQLLADVAMARMAETEDEAPTVAASFGALQDAADAIVTRMEAALEEAMDEPLENDGPSPRQMIAESLDRLEVIDAGLRQISGGGGDPRERELLLSWLNLVGQQTEVAEQAARDQYRVRAQRAAEAEAEANEPKANGE